MMSPLLAPTVLLSVNPSTMKRLLLNIATIPWILACSPVFYSPSSQHVPLLSEKNDFSASAGYVLAESTESVAVKAAYALGSRWGLMAGGSFHLREGNENTVASGDGAYIEAGGGYFTKISRKFVSETYGLVGVGNMSNYFPKSVDTYPNTNGRIKAGLLQIALQPAIGFKSRYFDAALSLKTSMLHYNNIRGALITQNIDQQNPSSQQAYLANHRNNVLLEPAITLRGGLDDLKLQLQGGASFNLSHPNFPQDASWVSFGLVYNPIK